MSTTDFNTIQRLPLRFALDPSHRAKVAQYAQLHASPIAKRALLAMLGRTS